MVFPQEKLITGIRRSDTSYLWEGWAVTRRPEGAFGSARNIPFLMLTDDGCDYFIKTY